MKINVIHDTYNNGNFHIVWNNTVDIYLLQKNLKSYGGAHDDDNASTGSASLASLEASSDNYDDNASTGSTYLASLKSYSDNVTGFLQGQMQQRNTLAHPMVYKSENEGHP